MMFRILIVEDYEDLLEELVRGFSRWFSNSKIEAAMSVEDGLRLLNDSNANRLFYDAVVLDFKLPKQKGLEPEVDETLCGKIRESAQSPLVIHITGHIADVKVLEHLKNFHKGNDPSWELLDKNDVSWVTDIMKAIKSYLYGNRIEEQINRLFGVSEHSYFTNLQQIALSKSSMAESFTIEISMLVHEIAALWDDLDERLKIRIQRIFSVDTTSRPIRITVSNNWKIGH